MPVNEPIAYAERFWHIQLKRQSGDEWSGPCPQCGGVDRFNVWADKQNFWCRQCGYAGFLDELENGNREMTTEQKVEYRLRQIERRQQEYDRRLSALERMHNCTDHIHYHENIPLDKMEYWIDEGMTVDTIVAYQLGWCPRCPTDKEGRSSFTIPVYDRDGETLVNIRHRLENASDGDKYRPHIAGLGAQLFNARFTQHPGDQIIITEGEKKSIILSQYDYVNVSIMGKRSFKADWVNWLKPFKMVYVALDPDAMESAGKLARIVGGRVVSLPVKADDFFVRYGGTKDDFDHFVSKARQAKEHKNGKAH